MVIFFLCMKNVAASVACLAAHSADDQLQFLLPTEPRTISG